MYTTLATTLAWYLSALVARQRGTPQRWFTLAWYLSALVARQRVTPQRRLHASVGASAWVPPPAGSRAGGTTPAGSRAGKPASSSQRGAPRQRVPSVVQDICCVESPQPYLFTRNRGLGQLGLPSCQSIVQCMCMCHKLGKSLLSPLVN